MAVVVTGALGFIGSCLASFLNQKGINDLILVDDFSRQDKWDNLNHVAFSAKLDRDIFLHSMHQYSIDFIFHIGARTDTTEFDSSIFDKLNLNYSKTLWNYCSQHQIPLVYASSAATYGSGELGFNDEDPIESLKPLNPYGQSKQDFDLWALEQTNSPPFWVGLKFFNVFGPNEYHKGRMASVVFHAYNQIQSTSQLKLFQSHNPDYQDGEQLRDFIYVKDLLNLLWFWYNNQEKSGIYNAGTGKAHTFNELATAIFSALELEPNIQYTPTPEDIRDKYQYFTEATMQKTINAGYKDGFTSLNSAVQDYITQYLQKGKHF
jgi:ADP-L-glycero-D-manno-heptose 6-epimerase